MNTESGGKAYEYSNTQRYTIPGALPLGTTALHWCEPADVIGMPVFT